MKYSNRFDRKKHKNMKRARMTILFIIISILVIIASAIIAQKFSTNKQVVQALESKQDTKSGSSDNQSKNETDSNALTTESNSEVENAAFVEKYLDQQMKQQMPDGADGKKVAYLTFDDGPSETVTPQVLDVLKAENVHATFFLIGKYIDKDQASKDLVKREFDEGNAIGNHTYSHDYNYLYPNGKINLERCRSDFEKTSQSLKNILGEDFSTRAVRFPGGQMTWDKKDPSGAEAIDKALQDKDLHQIDWNSLSGDAEGAHKKAEQLKLLLKNNHESI